MPLSSGRWRSKVCQSATRLVVASAQSFPNQGVRSLASEGVVITNRRTCITALFRGNKLTKDIGVGDKGRHPLADPCA
eukprot:5622106-Amphidinium_carterae.1